MYTYNIPMFTWYKELSVLLKCITCPSSLADIELSNIDTVRELLRIRDEVLICPISHSAAGTLKSWRSENHTPHYYWLNQSK